MIFHIITNNLNFVNAPIYNFITYFASFSKVIIILKIHKITLKYNNKNKIITNLERMYI